MLTAVPGSWAGACLHDKVRNAHPELSKHIAAVSATASATPKRRRTDKEGGGKAGSGSDLGKAPMSKLALQTGLCTPHEPFNSTPVAANSIPSGSPHVRPMRVYRTCGEPGEIKKNTHPKHVTALFRGQARSACRG